MTRSRRDRWAGLSRRSKFLGNSRLGRVIGIGAVRNSAGRLRTPSALPGCSRVGDLDQAQRVSRSAATALEELDEHNVPLLRRRASSGPAGRFTRSSERFDDSFASSGRARRPQSHIARPLGLRFCACRMPAPQQRHDSALPEFCRSQRRSVLRFTGCSSDPMALHPCNMPTGDRSPLLCRS
jgi:hypothetical protein